MFRNFPTTASFSANWKIVFNAVPCPKYRFTELSTYDKDSDMIAEIRKPMWKSATKGRKHKLSVGYSYRPKGVLSFVKSLGPVTIKDDEATTRLSEDTAEYTEPSATVESSEVDPGIQKDAHVGRRGSSRYNGDG